MDWNSLKIFLAIANTGSLSGAAGKLGVNHSTVFRRLNAFEEDIGGRVFERLNNRYELTALGQEVLALAHTIEESFDALDRHLVGKDIQPRGTVKITAPNSIAYHFLPRYITDFNRLFPDIYIQLLVSNQEFNMNNRQADIAVRATPEPPGHLVGRQVANIGWSVYGGKHYQQQTGFPASVDELATHNLIGATGSLMPLSAFIWMEKHFAEQISTRSDDLTAMSYLVEAGRGLACLPDDQVRPELIRLFPLQKNIVSKLWLLTHPDLRNVERIRLVMQHLTQAFAEEDWN